MNVQAQAPAELEITTPIGDASFIGEDWVLVLLSLSLMVLIAFITYMRRR